ncbi:hypothetical protein QQF64_021529 [Cirrhinus molitorella]|uniref:Uncharacterized protein n=1 Tax=Cirrhinus molitorella TaxID=172907 RepID=A0ABR3L5K4_9TELE
MLRFRAAEGAGAAGRCESRTLQGSAALKGETAVRNAAARPQNNSCVFGFCSVPLAFRPTRSSNGMEIKSGIMLRKDRSACPNLLNPSFPGVTEFT